MKKNPDLSILLLTAILLLTGTIMIFSASSPTCAMLEDFNNDQYYYLKRHLINVFLGIGAFILAYKLDPKKLEKYSPLCYLGALLMLIMVLLPGIGIVAKGARRWLGFGSFTFQPAEFAKALFVIFLAEFLAKTGDKIKNIKYFLKITGLTILLMILIEAEPDLGTALSIAGILIIMLYISGANIKYILSICALGVIGICVLLITGHSYRINRMKAFLNPWQDAQDTGYHVCQSLIAVGSGGVTGVGFGDSRQKFFYLPEQHTDFIFAVISEELGFVGSFMIVMLFILILYKGFKTASETNDSFLRLLAVGSASMIAFQAFMNIGVVIGIVPCTGIPLPFLSYGGSSLITTMFLMGLLFNVSKYCSRHGRGWELGSDDEEFDSGYDDEQDDEVPDNIQNDAKKESKNYEDKNNITKSDLDEYTETPEKT